MSGLGRMPGPRLLENGKMHASKRVLLALSLLAGAASGWLAAPALAADAAAGRAKVRALCQNCHGENGVAVLPGAANLSGQQREYLMAQLRAYRSGARQNEQMSIVAKTLTDADIEIVADWYSAIKVTVEMPK
jgi:cytochrome c553